MSKLDKFLTNLCDAFGLILKSLVVLLIPLVIVEQICIYAYSHAMYVLPILIGLIIIQIVIAVGINLRKKERK